MLIGDSTKVPGEVNGIKSREVTQKSSAQDLEPVDVSVKADETWPKLQERHYATESDAGVENSSINNVNISFSQEENLSLPIQPPGAVGTLAKDESDNIISLSQTEPDSITIKPVISEASISDGLINVSCPLSSDLPTNEAYDEIKKDNMKEKHKMADQTSMLFQENEKQVGEATVDNQKETAISSKLQTGKTSTSPQQSNGPDKEAVGETGDLQSSHKHKVQKSEVPIRDIKEEREMKRGIASESETETSSLSPKRPAGSSEDMLCTEVESGSEPQTVYDQSLRQTPTATLERSADRDTAPDLSAALGQSLSSPDPSCFAQQQEQQQQRLGSRHPTEELSGGCLEGVEKTNSQAQTLVPGVQVGADKGDGSVGSLCQSGSRDESTRDDSRGSERMIGVEKRDGEGAQAAKGVDKIYVPSHIGNDLNQSGKAAERNASADIVIVTTCSDVSERGQAMDENKSPGLGGVGSNADLMLGTEFESGMSGKGQQKSKLSGARQDQHGKLETSANTAVSVESASQGHEISPFQISVSSKVSTDSQDIHTEVISSANQAEEIHTKIFSALPDSVGQPETVEKDFSAAMAVKSNSGETEECEFLPLELQSSNKTSATQSSPVVQTPIKGPDVEEITGEDKAALDEEKTSSQGKGQNEIKVINSEATEKRGVVNQTLEAKDSGSESVKTSDPCESGVSHSSTETADCHSDEGGIALSKATENDNDITDKITPDVITDPTVVSSKCPEDFASLHLETPNELEKLHDQVSLSKPLDNIVVNPIGAASRCEWKSHDEAPARISPVEQLSVKAQSADVSESPAPRLTAQEPDTNWIKALKEAASQSQSEQVNTVETTRPLPSLESPQLEFLTPTEEVATSLRQEEIPSPEQAAEKTAEIPPPTPVKKPVDLPEPLKKSAELPEPTQRTVEFSKPTQSTKIQPTKAEEEPPEELPEAQRGASNFFRKSRRASTATRTSKKHRRVPRTKKK
ncbi:uncharacterized protein LOC127138919 [Lates calcarifer]|uniref:Uncharacterized protein LOC127138919 n=1 Tax=Lates calcarifer TaxID=8187 RepID=A0AAJ8BHH6_LATCA|nr:uncharacterized protein LOC127138919 [Lates calcarifer]